MLKVGNASALDDCPPPIWLPEVTDDADLGYPGFHPPDPRQPEDVLSERAIKEGLKYVDPVAAETYSAQGTVKNPSSHFQALEDLEKLMEEVLLARAEATPLIPSPSFKIPSRVTLNDVKRQAWFADLANPNHSLHKLGKSVPHGVRGHDLLDMLHANDVAIPRAFWFLRVFGANETAGLRNKPHYNPSQYSVEWTNVISSYISKLLGEIALPSAPRLGLNVKQTFKTVFSDPESRSLWISKYRYCLRLLRPFYTQGLVDHKTFATWLVYTMRTCHLGQAGFVAKLADEYFECLAGSRALLHPMLEATFAQLSYARKENFLEAMIHALGKVVMKSCLASPEAAFNPRMFSNYKTLLSQVVSKCSTSAISTIVETTALLIIQRNSALLFHDFEDSHISTERSSAEDVKTLNAVCIDTDMQELDYFGQDDAHFAAKLNLLLTWSVTKRQFGYHRPYLVVTLLSNWHLRSLNRSQRRNKDNSSSHVLLQDTLFRWLDQTSLASDKIHIDDIAHLFGELGKVGLFSMGEYIQRLITRGEMGLLMSSTEPSRHQPLIRAIPVYDSQSPLVNQRKSVLYGPRARQTEEDQNAVLCRRYLKQLAPSLFRESRQDDVDTLDISQQFQSLPRHDRAHAFEQLIIPRLRKHIKHLDRVIVTAAFRSIVELATKNKWFTSLLEICLEVLPIVDDVQLLVTVLDVLHHYCLTWACMSKVGLVAEAIFTAHQQWKLHEKHSREILQFIVDSDHTKHLNESAQQTIAGDLQSLYHSYAVSEALDKTLPNELPEILTVLQTEDDESLVEAARNLWFRYKNVSKWAQGVWSSVVFIVRKLKTYVKSETQIPQAIKRLSDFLLKIDTHVPRGLKKEIAEWLTQEQRLMQQFTDDEWTLLSELARDLIECRILDSATILRSMVQPALLSARALDDSQSDGEMMEHYLLTVIHFLELSVIRSSHPNFENNRLPATGVPQHALDDDHFHALMCLIPIATILEESIHLPESVRTSIGHARKAICKNIGFRESLNRDLQIAHQAFKNVYDCSDLSISLRETLGDAMRLVLHGEDADANDIDERWSPWNLAASSVEHHFILQELDALIERDESSQWVDEKLGAIVSNVFGGHMSDTKHHVVRQLAFHASSRVAAKIVQLVMPFLWDSMDQPWSEDSRQRLEDLLSSLSKFIGLFYGQNDTAVVSIPDGVKNRLIDLALAACLEPQASTEKSQNVILRCRLLQFHLLLSDSFQPVEIPPAQNLIETLMDLILANTDRQTGMLVSTAYETILVIIDGLQNHAQIDESPDLFKYYPTSRTLSTGIPEPLRSQLRSLMPYSSAVRLTHQLSTLGTPEEQEVVNRPWEWTEYLAEMPPLESGLYRKNEDAVADNGSVSLAHFGAWFTGESVASHIYMTEKAQNGVPVNDMCSFQDGFHSESLFARDWRESRLKLDDSEESANEADDMDESRAQENAAAVATFSLNSGSGKSSPANHSTTSRSRGGGTSSSSSRKPTPSQDERKATGRKRKAMSPTDEDDGQRQLREPVPVVGLREKRGRGGRR